MSGIKILVIGLGELGRPVVESLAQHPFVTSGRASLSVLLRPSTAKTYSLSTDYLFGSLKGIRAVPLDLESALLPELSDAFRSFDVVVSCTGFVSGAGGLQRKLCQAVLDAGVKLYVPWQFGVDYDRIGRGSPQDLFDEQLDVRDALRAQEETASVIVSTGMFTSFLFEPWFGVVEPSADGAIVRALGGWENEVTVTSPEDIGRLTARILLDPQGALEGLVLQRGAPRHQVVYVAGDTISYSRLADIIQRSTGTTVQREVWTVDQLKKELVEYPNDAIRKYRAVFALGVGVAWDKAATYNVRNGIEVEDVEQWAAKHFVS